MNWPPKRVYKHQIKAQKLDQLIGPQIANDSSPEGLKTIFSTLENFPLSDPLSKMLKNFFDELN